MPVTVTWLGHASVMIGDGHSVVFIDPWKTGTGLPQADLILVTHEHYDHYSESDIRALSKDSTRVVAPMSTPLVTDVIAPGGRLDLGGAVVSAVPAYNIGKRFHPRESGGVGYVLELSGRRIYYAGDTDAIPEMREIDVDAALIPVGGTYTMDALEAAQAAGTMKARVFIPTHYGDIVGSRDDAKAFAGHAGSDTLILEPGGSTTLA
ncbi:MAG TPA: MBL fold metallo-hydrolase [Deltaproteobacteria bacterium]|nr:MBL fold metallo-hydrolase [Deltaproteobacteria bacterium]HOI06487.1 MBL fold metallo-hydrolase [Deltaproteobacteria bacterium]